MTQEELTKTITKYTKETERSSVLNYSKKLIKAIQQKCKEVERDSLPRGIIYNVIEKVFTDIFGDPMDWKEFLDVFSRIPSKVMSFFNYAYKVDMNLTNFPKELNFTYTVSRVLSGIHIEKTFNLNYDVALRESRTNGKGKSLENYVMDWLIKQIRFCF